MPQLSVLFDQGYHDKIHQSVVSQACLAVNFISLWRSYDQAEKTGHDGAHDGGVRWMDGCSWNLI